MEEHRRSEERVKLGFGPVFDGNSRVLILGSFPSVLSRAAGFYYGNPRNRFWGMLSRALGEEAGESAEEKTAFLLRHRVALWDAAIRCEIEGSMDSDIRGAEPADVPRLLAAAPIRTVLCNGRKSRDLLARFHPGIPAVLLPSTSPANPRYREDVWIAAIRESLAEK